MKARRWIYLPRYVGAEEHIEDAEQSQAATGAIGTETILVVEDDDALRTYTVETLTEFGYRVLAATRGGAALEILDGGNDVDLLFTDVVMPGGINGRQLADEAVRRRPGLKVLFTTGYTRNAIVHHGRLDPGVEMIGKPFSIDELTRKVRAILDGGAWSKDRLSTVRSHDPWCGNAVDDGEGNFLSVCRIAHQPRHATNDFAEVSQPAFAPCLADDKLVHDHSAYWWAFRQTPVLAVHLDLQRWRCPSASHKRAGQASAGICSILLVEMENVGAIGRAGEPPPGGRLRRDVCAAPGPAGLQNDGPDLPRRTQSRR
jgi:CheY-like chemotaxis protein